MIKHTTLGVQTVAHIKSLGPWNTAENITDLCDSHELFRAIQWQQQVEIQRLVAEVMALKAGLLDAAGAKP